MPKDFGQFSDPLADPRGSDTSAISRATTPAAADRLVKLQRTRDANAAAAESAAEPGVSRLLTHPIQTIALGILSALGTIAFISLIIWLFFGSMNSYGNSGR